MDAKYSVTLAEYSATLIGNELTVVNRMSMDTKGTDSIQVSGNSCSATHIVDQDSHTYVDKTCRAVSCTVAIAPMIASRAPPPTSSAVAPAPAPKSNASSCSDITGTNSQQPAAKHCSNAKAQLRGARINRTKIPGYSAEQYKGAAAAYRLAGDYARALLVEAEAAEPAPEPEAFTATEALLTNKKKVAADAMLH